MFIKAGKAMRGQNGLNKHEVNEILLLLLKERSELLGKPSLISELSGCQPSSDACDNMEEEVLDVINLTDKQRKKLRRLDAAITRMESGDYGRCMNKDCENDHKIDFARLKAHLVATYCMDCICEQEQREKRMDLQTKTRMVFAQEFEE